MVLALNRAEAFGKSEAAFGASAAQFRPSGFNADGNMAGQQAIGLL